MNIKNVLNTARLENILKLLAICLFISACSLDEAGWNDERYAKDFNLYFDNPNPKTGLTYTEEETEELKYDPKEEERFESGKDVQLSLLVSKPIASMDVLDGTDLSVLLSNNDFQEDGEMYRINFNTTLEELKIPEGESKILKFDVVYQDNSIGSIQFKVISIIPLPPVSESLVGHWNFENLSDPTAAILGEDLGLGGEKNFATVSGITADDNAVLINQGSYLEIIHGLSASSGDKVNEYTLVYDINLPATSYGSYANLLQTLVDNSSDGAVYIAPNGGMWLNGFGTFGGGAIAQDTWHRVVLSVGPNAFRLHVDGNLVASASPSADGIFSMDLEKGLIFADNNGEDAPIKITDLMLFDITFTNEQAIELPGVGLLIE